ncbi:L-histidine N(alpha)-methyltransferase [Pareuzebyella sediminis]|uniref:L-histidine N(alpha)-methyltransferase n=1 Tax=Pareuzebyella sediminis TaxID=2607998 RepID=UPI0011EF6A63|nr:L-histidine N(alpha)-methyltransferase [Pareuzebyella sediminis]
MQKTVEIAFETKFEEEVYNGLTTFPKHLSSMYFYDETGDKLFQDIMNMPEYYLTDYEFNILTANKAKIGHLFARGDQRFKLIELGAGDGKKTKILLKHLIAKSYEFTYQPIDISPTVLKVLEQSLHYELPELQIEPQQGTYFEALKKINAANGTRKIILFLGSNIGNLMHEKAIDFLGRIQQLMHTDDLFFVGFDMKKDPNTILNAYNDETGITAAFNKNILARINRELDGNFDTEKFLHWEVYDPESGTAKSYLVAKEAQTISIEKLGLTVDFQAWETLHTEISQKYDENTIEKLAQKSGFEIVCDFSDDAQGFKDYVFRKV